MTGRNAIGFHIVTGFLGAGKTTLINRLLRAAALADALVIVNEWGEIGLDRLLYETLTGDAILISGGCVCCALRGDLVETLRNVVARRDSGALPFFGRIETTGLAEPGESRRCVDSELTCPVLVAHQMSASSAFVLPVGMWATRLRCPHFHRRAAERI